MELYLGRPPAQGGYHYLIGDDIWSEGGRRYEINDRLGAGGNAVVHVSTDTVSAVKYAAKFQLRLDGVRRERFNRERELVSTATHPHLIRCHDGGMIDGVEVNVAWQNGRLKRSEGANVSIPFIVMDRADTTLASLLQGGDQVGSEVYLAQFRGLCDALGVLHRHAVHRDIKPSNILVVGDRWVLSDYGLCSFLDSSQLQLTADDERVGPRDWMSPEAENRAQGGNDEITTASDVFQLAHVLWYVATGQKIHGVVDPTAWPGPHRLQQVVVDALSVDARQRPQDGAELVARFNDALFS